MVTQVKTFIKAFSSYFHPNIIKIIKKEYFHINCYENKKKLFGGESLFDADEHKKWTKTVNICYISFS